MLAFWKNLQIAFIRIKFHGGFFKFFLAVLNFFGQNVSFIALSHSGFLRGYFRNRSAYEVWVSTFEKSISKKLLRENRQRDFAAAQPMISLVLVSTASNTKDLIDCVRSIVGQFYRNWELQIALFNISEEARGYFVRLAESDLRVKTDLALDGSPTELANRALNKAIGRYIVFLDGRGMLNPEALFRVANKMSLNTDACFAYCDEDRIDSENHRFLPHFKPDWNPDYFLTWDYAGPFKVFRVDVARKLNGFRCGFGDSQQYDLALRAMELSDSKNILHIPHILYHNSIPVSNCGNNEARRCKISYPAVRAVVEHLERTGVSASVSRAPEAPACLRVRYALPLPLPNITLIIPTRNRVELLRRCIESIVEITDYANYDIIVVDNDSDDLATLNYLESIHGKERMQVIRDEGTFNFSRLNNLAVRRASGQLIGLLNNDLEATHPDWLSEMVSQAVRADIAVVGARLWYPNDTIQHAGVVLADGVPGHVHNGLARGNNGYFGRAVLTQNFTAVTAACMVMRKNIYVEVGGLDEAFAVAFNDIDFCLRARALGYRNLWTPYAELYHHESASRGLENTTAKISRYFGELTLLRERWKSQMFSDPYYNPNLNPRLKDFSLAWPPTDFGHNAG